MEFFRVPEGPWQKIFSGSFQGHSTTLFSSEAGMLMSAVLDGPEESPSGVLMEFFRAFKCEGQLEGFVETLPRDVRVIIRHSEKRTSKFFLLSSSPSYSAYNEEDVLSEADSLLRKLSKQSDMVRDIAKAYDLKLREMKELPEDEKSEFFSEPLVVGMAVPSPIGTIEEPPSVLKGEVFLGISPNEAIVREPLALFKKTVVFGPEAKHRRHAMHIIAEGTLLSNIPVVIVDSDDAFLGISEAASQPGELKKFKVDAEPIGFPAKQFRLGQGFSIDLNKINPAGLLELYGAGQGTASKAIEQALDQKKAGTMQELAEMLRSIEATEEFSDYEKARTARILELIDSTYPLAFGEGNDIAEISKNWIKGIGMAGIIRLKGFDERISLLALHTLALELLEYYKAKGKASGVRSMLLIPNGQAFLPIEANNVFSKEIAGALLEAAEYGVGFALECEKSIDLDRELSEKAEAEITLVQGNDAGVRLAGKKQYRVFLRPGLSRCTELQ